MTGWEDRLAHAGVSPHHEPARLAVVDVIDRALEAGVPEQTIDAALERLRAEAARTNPHTTEAGSSPGLAHFDPR